MTDYFALLGQARSPWLDPEELKQAFHTRTLQSHPDAQLERTAESEVLFAQLNEAYQALRDPKRRLQHLLALGGEKPAPNDARIPAEIEELFPAVARLTRQADTVLQKIAVTSSALAVSLVRPEVLHTRIAVKEMIEQLQQLHDEAEKELRAYAPAWEGNSEISQRVLRDLYLRYSYLARWMGELQEKQLLLSSA
jgi:curved DNA-binding protein CbpA